MNDSVDDDKRLQIYKAVCHRHPKNKPVDCCCSVPGSTIHKTSLFIQQSNRIIIHLAQKIPSIPPPIPPPKQHLFSSFSSSILILSHLPIYFCVPVPYLTQATSLSPHSHLFLTNPSERNHSSQCVVEAFRFTRPHFSISARLFMLMGSVEVGFQCSKSTMDLVKKKEEKKRDVRLGLKCKRGMGGEWGDFFYSVLVSRSQRMFRRAQS